MTNLDSVLKSRDITLPANVPIVRAVVFPIVMHGCENCTIKKAEHWSIDAFELWCWRRLLRVPWTDSMEIKPVNPEGDQPWIFTARTEAEGEAPIVWPPDAKIWLIWKDPDSGKDWRQEENGKTEEMIGWQHWLKGHEFQQVLGDGEGQRSLACCSPWGRRESDMTDWLNNNKEIIILREVSEKDKYHMVSLIREI